jgi:ATP-dependent RNA helicase DeaD
MQGRPLETKTTSESLSFQSFGFRPSLLKAIADMGFAEPTPIQRELMPLALAGRNVLGQARTGTGKTAAFLLPIIQQIERRRALQAMVLAPTRELAKQVTDECHALCKYESVRAICVYGGVRIRRQIDALKRTPQIVIGTPGRFKDHLGRRTIKLNQIRFVVLDEVDRMLDIGFREEIDAILSRIKHPHQTIFVSATISEEIERLAACYARDAERVFLSTDDLTRHEVEQLCLVVDLREKFAALLALLAAEKPELAIVFTATKREAGLLAKGLKNEGVDAREIHGDMFQNKRDKVMDRFRDGKLHILVATDLASRGIDVENISHIINYDIPQDPEVYVHRIGRTARMGAPGRAITFVDPFEGPQLVAIERLIGKQLALLEVPGVERRDRPAVASAQERLPRFKRSLFEERKQPVHRTLGGKFPPARGRRRP